MKLVLNILQGGDGLNQATITLDHEDATIGRLENNALVLSDDNRWISGQHAAISYQAPDYFITDTSTNGLIINQASQALGRDNTVKLKHDDLLYIGEYVIEVKLLALSNDSIIDLKPTSPVMPKWLDDPFAELAAQALAEINEDAAQPVDWPETAGKKNIPQSQENNFDNLPVYKEPAPAFRRPEPKVVAATSIPASKIPEDWFIAEADQSNAIKTFEFKPEVEVVVDSTPKTPQATSPVTNELLAAFLQGAGLEHNPAIANLDAKSFYVIGSMLKEAVKGAQGVLVGRAKIKNEMHLDVTMIRAAENNPIKFSVTPEEALLKLLTSHDKGYLKPEAAIQEAFDDIKAHQYAVIAGMRTALLAVLARFDPKKLEQRLQEDSPISASIPVHKQLKLWGSFGRLYKDIEQEAEDNFYHLFGEAFAESYEQQMQHFKKPK